MSKDNILNKEFAKKDVERLRNVLSGKAGQRSTEGVGYTKATEFHKEGDVWTENGREWTIKDGIKQNLTKLDKAKSLAMPMFCPSCKKIMKGNNDKEFWTSFRRCFDCQVDFENELRIKGLWKEYQKSLHNEGVDNFTQNYKQWAEDMLNSNNEGFVTEAGDVEKWVGSSKKKLLENKEETIKYLQSLKK
jgi:hypothetical protein